MDMCTVTSTWNPWTQTMVENKEIQFIIRFCHSVGDTVQPPTSLFYWGIFFSQLCSNDTGVPPLHPSRRRINVRWSKRDQNIHICTENKIKHQSYIFTMWTVTQKIRKVELWYTYPSSHVPHGGDLTGTYGHQIITDSGGGLHQRFRWSTFPRTPRLLVLKPFQVVKFENNGPRFSNTYKLVPFTAAFLVHYS